jgi:hypothetical protein
MTDDRESILYRINRELHAHGVQYTGDDPIAASNLLKHVRKNRSGKPPCYQRSFAHDDPVCRQCEVFRGCLRGTIVPKFTLDHPGLVSCDWCDGDFLVELYGKDGVIVDYGCSTDGCRNTYRLQTDGKNGR